MVMLDLNMPRMGGIEFLDEIRADETLRSTLVFVVTTSDYHADVRSAYSRMVCGYFLKPDTVIPPFLTGCGRRTYAAIFSFCAGVMPPMPMLGRSLL